MRILITGAGTGIGRALSERLVQRNNCTIIAVGRRLDPLKELKDKFPAKVKIIQADVSDENDRAKIIESIKNDEALTHVVHNAAIIEPIESITKITLSDYRKQQAINVEAPVFLTQGLLPLVISNCRFLFISSGAAYSPWQGIASYSISKAALEMVCKSYQQEYNDKTVRFASLRPGGVETPITEKLSKMSPLIFPNVRTIFKKRSEGTMLQPDTSAKFIEWVLINTPENQYEKDWNINNEKDKMLWKINKA